jgi:hypothetical protein
MTGAGQRPIGVPGGLPPARACALHASASVEVLVFVACTQAHDTWGAQACDAASTHACVEGKHPHPV